MPFLVRGFTMVESVIVLAIIVLIAAIVLANFPGFSQAINLQRSGQELALAFRRAQSLALAVREVDITCPLASPPNPSGVCLSGITPGRHLPQSYGVSIDFAKDQTSYIIFADFRGEESSSADGIYQAADDVVVEKIPLIGNGNFISTMVTTGPGSDTQRRTVINVTFSVPDANMTIANDRQALTAQTVQITLQGQSLTFTKTVTVRSTGQIGLK